MTNPQTANPRIAERFSLDGKHAVVTGGGSGIGFAIAAALTSAGARTTLVGRNAQRLHDAAKQIAAQCENSTQNNEKRNDSIQDNAQRDNTTQNTDQRDDSIKTFPCDLLHLDAIADHAGELARAHGEVDILVNAAGWRTRQTAAEITPAVWRATVDTNLSAPFFLARAFAPAMRARGWGRVLNIASLQSRLAFDGGIAYGASKGGVAQLTRAMANEWSAHGINANAIAPGFFPTDMTASLFDDAQVAAALAARTAIGRNGELADLQGAALFLCAPASDYITGQVLYIDGGFTAK